MNKVNTLEQVLEILLSKMHVTSKTYLKNSKEEDLIQFHHTLGMHIRNKFRLWVVNIALTKDMGLEKDTHADEVSQKIIEALWKRLQKDK